MSGYPGFARIPAVDDQHRGGKFLKAWMAFLEENADLRYPDIGQALRDE